MAEEHEGRGKKGKEKKKGERKGEGSFFFFLSPNVEIKPWFSSGTVVFVRG